jgi:ferritin-like metal-binding protein YciE
MKMDSLKTLFVHEIKDLLSAEKQILKALPKMAKGATSPELKAAFAQHLTETEGQVGRLEQILESLGASSRSITCKGMEGLIAEGSELLEMEGDPMTLDAGIIAAAQKVEHYEICGYGTVRAYARQLGLQDAERLLAQTLEEESKTDKLLSQLAEAGINQMASA